jgi:hypothetical protein
MDREPGVRLGRAQHPPLPLPRCGWRQRTTRTMPTWLSWGLGELVEQVLHRRAHALLLATTRPCRRLASKLAQIRLLIVVEAHGAGERDED